MFVLNVSPDTNGLMSSNWRLNHNKKNHLELKAKKSKR